MSEPRIVTFDTPISKTTTAAIVSVEVFEVLVNVKAKRVSIRVSVNGEEPRFVQPVKTDAAYDASNIQNFWPAIDGWVKEMAAAGTLF